MVFDELWAITAFFNPVRYRTRLLNYRTFRQRLNIPLVAVELSNDGSFELGPGDADILLQVQSSSILWHKERLLNLAISALPASCRKVAWLDGDIVFVAEDWAVQASQCLDDYLLVQLFSHLYDVPASTDSTALHLRHQWPTRRSAVSLLARGQFDESFFTTPGASYQGRYSPGFAWAARREILQSHRLYDACILGGADKAIFSAAVGRMDEHIEGYGFNRPQADHYKAWAQPFHQDLQGDLGFLDTSILHLWHGTLANRRYRQKVFEFRQYEFNPYTDIASNEDGCLKWSSSKASMHAYVFNYFHNRCEDDGG